MGNNFSHQPNHGTDTLYRSGDYEPQQPLLPYESGVDVIDDQLLPSASHQTLTSSVHDVYDQQPMPSTSYFTEHQHSISPENGGKLGLQIN